MENVNLIRLGDTGIFAFPENLGVGDARLILLNGNSLIADQYTVNDNGDIDVTEVDENSVVSIVLKDIDDTMINKAILSAKSLVTDDSNIDDIISVIDTAVASVINGAE